jgi:hypothetical protein
VEEAGGAARRGIRNGRALGRFRRRALGGVRARRLAGPGGRARPPARLRQRSDDLGRQLSNDDRHVGNRGPVRSKDEATPYFGPRFVRWATHDEHQSTIAESAIFIVVGLILLVLGALANLFFQVPAASLTISAVAVVLFAGYILYDVSQIVNGGETNYVMATLKLYIDIYNIFVHLLNLLLFVAGNRD